MPTWHATDSLDWFKCPLLHSCCTLHISESQLVSEEDLVTLLPSALSLLWNAKTNTNANTNAQQQIQIQSHKYVEHRSPVPSQLVAKCCLLFQVHAGHADTCDKYVHKHRNTQIHMDRHTSAKTGIETHIQRYKCKDMFIFLVILLPSTLSCAQRNARGWQIYPQKKKPPYLSFQKLFALNFCQCAQFSFCMMGFSEKLCLQWNDFKENITFAFKELRTDKEFTDVSLACGDGKQ